MLSRPSKIDYYMNIAGEVAGRSTCYRAKHGAIIVRDDQIISTGYLGSPRKTKDCWERGNCLRELMKVPHGQRYELCRSVHAEQNAIINAARAGASLLGSTMYLYSTVIRDGQEKPQNAYPCFICKKMIINAGIEKLVGRQADGSLKTYEISDWIKDWQDQDMFEDTEQYGAAINAEQAK
jgi:dCMP deaminase